jgi:hypothetical protein
MPYAVILGGRLTLCHVPCIYVNVIPLVSGEHMLAGTVAIYYLANILC